MKYRRLDENGDYIFGGSTSDFLIGSKAISQVIKTSLLFFQGEWWENQLAGLPMFQSILGRPGNNTGAIDLIFKNAILKISNVKNISEFKSTLVNRQYSFYCAVNTNFGPILAMFLPDIMFLPDTSAISFKSILTFVDEDNGFNIVDEDNDCQLTS